MSGPSFGRARGALRGEGCPGPRDGAGETKSRGGVSLRTVRWPRALLVVLATITIALVAVTVTPGAASGEPGPLAAVDFAAASTNDDGAGGDGDDGGPLSRLRRLGGRQQRRPQGAGAVGGPLDRGRGHLHRRGAGRRCQLRRCDRGQRLPRLRVHRQHPDLQRQRPSGDGGPGRARSRLRPGGRGRGAAPGDPGTRRTGGGGLLGRGAPGGAAERGAALQRHHQRQRRRWVEPHHRGQGDESGRGPPSNSGSIPTGRPASSWRMGTPRTTRAR